MAKDQEAEITETPRPAPVAAKPAPAKLAGPPSGARVTPQRGARPQAPKLPPPVPSEGTVERHRYDREKEGNAVPAWKHAAAKAMNRWPVGAEVSRKDYDAAITQAETIRVQ